MKKEYRCVEKTKKAIRAAFVELLGEKKNMETITVAELVKRADIAKSTFYNHYDDIYAVAEEFEDELINEMSDIFIELETNQFADYEEYIRKFISFLKENEYVYRKAIMSSDTKFFIEKSKTIISKSIFERSAALPFSNNSSEKYIQVRLLTNACVDTLCDYFIGNIHSTIDEVGEVIISFLTILANNRL